MKHRIVRLRHGLAVPACVLGCIALAVGSVVQPDSDGDAPRDLIAAVASSPGRWAAGWTIILLASLLLVAGLGGLVGRLTGRGSAVGTVGGLLLAAGFVGLVGVAAAELLLVPLTDGGAGGPGVAQAVNRVGSSPALGVVYLLFLPGLVFGTPLLWVGLVRAGLAAWWSLAAAVFFVVTEMGLGEVLHLPDGSTAVVLAAAFADVAVRARGAAAVEPAPEREPAAVTA